jgi:hypothetical protein
MFNNLWTFVKKYGSKIVETFILLCFVYWFLISPIFWTSKTATPLKEYKDGIQNHLTWNIKGECFFVRPNDDVTVYLVRVQDCDKK